MLYSARSDDHCQTVTMRMGTHDLVILLLDHEMQGHAPDGTPSLESDVLTTLLDGASAASGTLSARQRVVLEHLAQGLTMRQIGARMGYSDSTIRMESLVIYRSLGVHDRDSAVRVARANGLLAEVASV